MARPNDREDAHENEDDLRAAEQRAVVSLNDLLVGVLESLMEGQRLESLPPSVRSALDYLALEVAKLQGVTEWVAEDLVRLELESRGNDEE